MQVEAYERLTRSVSEFNQWKQGTTEEIDLEGADLSGRKLQGADLSGVNLKAAVLRDCRLEEANLNESVLYKADARGASFWRTRLSKAYAADAHLEGARFRQCRIEDASFARARLEGSSFDHSVIMETKFDGADLRGARFHGALLVGSSFDGADLRSAETSEVTRRNPGKNAGDTHLDFFWISDGGDDYAIGPLIFPAEGEPMSTYTESIRRFRAKDPEAIKRFAQVVAAIARKHHRFSACDTIVPVPSSVPGTAETGGTFLAAQVSKAIGIKDGSIWMERHKATLPSRLFASDSDDLERHTSTIRLTNPSIVPGRTILLFDDFLATGATVAACRSMLLEAGAKKVLGLFLGKRV